VENKLKGAKNMVKAFGYIRVSGKGQIDGDGFPRQEKAIRDYAKANGIEIVKIFREEGVSGTLQDRPALVDMVIELEENGHGVKTVLVEKMNRLARDLMIQENIIHDLQQKGFNLISAVEGDDLLSNDPTMVLIRQVLGSISQYEKQMLVQKLKASRQRIRARGQKCEGRKSYAEAKPEVLQEIKKLRRKPRGGKRMAWEAVSAILNEKGWLTASGKTFTGNNVSTILHRA